MKPKWSIMYEAIGRYMCDTNKLIPLEAYYPVDGADFLKHCLVRFHLISKNWPELKSDLLELNLKVIK